MRRIDAGTLRSWITDGAELALLDAREEGEFGASHLFWAVPCPYSKRELRAPSLLPQRGTRVVVCDDGRGVAEKLGAYLEGIGCTDVSVLDGGTPACGAAGYVLFSGVNVPSKLFGEPYNTDCIASILFIDRINYDRHIAGLQQLIRHRLQQNLRNLDVARLRLLLDLDDIYVVEPNRILHVLFI